jgi:hypothetical protein
MGVLQELAIASPPYRIEVQSPAGLNWSSPDGKEDLTFYKALEKPQSVRFRDNDGTVKFRGYFHRFFLSGLSGFLNGFRSL